MKKLPPLGQFMRMCKEMKPAQDSDDEEFSRKRTQEEEEKLQKKISTFAVDNRSEKVKNLAKQIESHIRRINRLPKGEQVIPTENE
jgi:Sec-independent protein translocase protein TatA